MVIPPLFENKTKTAMVLPVAKLGTLALRTLSKPIARRLKQQARVPSKFRQLIINIAQVFLFSQVFVKPNVPVLTHYAHYYQNTIVLNIK